MRFPKLLALAVLTIAGCSSPKTSSEENVDPNSVSSNTDPAEAFKLTEQEMERLRVELFHYLRQNEAYVTGDLTYVQHERFILYDEGFKYLAHYSPPSDDPKDESEELVVTGDIDSVSIEGHYQIVSASKSPEGGITTVTLIYSGTKITKEWVNLEIYSYEANEYGQHQVSYDRAQQHFENSIPEKTITLDVREPRIYSRSDMYLKLRISEITEKDVSAYSKDELGYMRNEVFARHGHTFKTPKMIAYFDKQDWYKSYVDDATPFLNDIEKKNVEFIKSKEQG